ncbi:hypothetical protein FRAHR75_510015 [Frankia sp. Hr75.2]|nr:hypothetical protein FRAHR75_510015 [Frankia sp. Hr75.2]SQD99668.1 hypothetical protein FMEAI12_5520001 [Parafrankia sp. Ea1.12]
MSTVRTPAPPRPRLNASHCTPPFRHALTPQEQAIYQKESEGVCRRCGSHGELAKAGRYADGTQQYRTVCKPCEAARALAYWRSKNPGADRMIRIPVSEHEKEDRA